MGVCVLAAALALLWTDTPTYDAYSWLNWGRQIVHGQLVTSDGPSWKPLPVMFTTVYALLGSSTAQALWMVTARAFALVAIVFAARVAWRAAGGPWGLLGAVLATAGILGSVHYLYGATTGASEPMGVALVLIAADRLQAGRLRQAFVALWMVGLIRPESWLLLGPYGLWLMWRDRGSRPLVLALGLLVPVLWFVPEWIGSGDPFRASARAREANVTTYIRHPHPVRHAWLDARGEQPYAVVLGLLAAMALPFLGRLRPRRALDPLVLGGFGFAWVILVLLMITNGYAGTVRYFMIGTAMMTVGGAAGWAAAQQVAWSATRSCAVRALVAVAALGVLAWTAHGVHDRYERTRHLVVDRTEALDRTSRQLTRIIRAAGGREFVMRCGRPGTAALQESALAWYLRTTILDVVGKPRRERHFRGYVFQVRLRAGWRPLLPRGARLYARNRKWRVAAVGCPVNA